MARQKPILGRVPKAGPTIPAAGKAAGDKLWTFSFRFWRQLSFFGLDKSDANWFVSLLEKLKDLCCERIEAFMADGAKKHTWRYHDISWTQKNIPIQRVDLTWLHKDYLENEAEYPLVQFQISQALGRVVGFWDEIDVFNIVLLDPLHNMQPSGRFDYRVTPNSPLPCKYTTLLEDLDRVKKNSCPTADCPVNKALQGVPSQDHNYTVTIMRIPDDIAKAAADLIREGHASSMQDILATGVLKTLEDAISK